MANILIPFLPTNDAGPLAATTTSGSTNVVINKDNDSIRLYNAGPNDVCVHFDIGTTAAVTTNMRIPVGGVETFTKGKADHIAAICATGTATVYITTGEGM